MVGFLGVVAGVRADRRLSDAVFFFKNFFFSRLSDVAADGAAFKNFPGLGLAIGRSGLILFV